MSFKIGRESDIMKLKSLAVLSMSAVVLTACGNDTQKMKQNQQSQILIKTLIQQKMLLL